MVDGSSDMLPSLFGLCNKLIKYYLPLFIDTYGASSKFNLTRMATLIKHFKC